MSRRLWKHRITDIIDAIKKIEKYVEEMEFDDFRKDEKTIDAVTRNFIIIGEAAHHVPDDISGKYPNIKFDNPPSCPVLKPEKIYKNGPIV